MSPKTHFYAWIIVLCLAGTSCEQVTKPTSDSTPPQLRWKLENLTTNTTIDITGSASYAPQTGDVVRITVIAEDPEGIHKIGLKGEFIHDCRTPDGSVAQAVSDSTFPLEQVLTPNPDGQVITTIILIDTFSFASKCDPDFQLVKLTAVISGRGENYFGGVTEATIDALIIP